MGNGNFFFFGEDVASDYYDYYFSMVRISAWSMCCELIGALLI